MKTDARAVAKPAIEVPANMHALELSLINLAGEQQELTVSYQEMYDAPVGTNWGLRDDDGTVSAEVVYRTEDQEVVVLLLRQTWRLPKEGTENTVVALTFEKETP